MKTFRRICIASVTLGAFFLFSRSDSAFDTLPLPGAGLSVKMLADVKTDADYNLVVAMPETNESLTFSKDTVPCSLIVRIAQPGKESIVADVISLSRRSEYGFAKVQYYSGGTWHLKPANYEIEIKSREECKAASLRGATVSLEKDRAHDESFFVQGFLRYCCGVIFLSSGIIGLIACEFKKSGKPLTNV